MLKFNKKIYLLTAILLSAVTPNLIFAEDELPAQAVKIISASQKKLLKVNKSRDKLVSIAQQTTANTLNKEMTVLTQMADLDRAIAARDLLRAVKDSTNIPPITPDEKKYRPNTIKIMSDYQKKLEQLSGAYTKSKQKIMEELTAEINKEMLKMNERGLISDSLLTKDLLEKVQAPGFDLLTYTCKVKQEPPKEEKKEVVKEKVPEPKPQVDSDQLIAKTALAMGNNILSDNIKSEKGLVFICFAESLHPEDETVMTVRERIERKVFLPILPCTMSEKEFIDTLAKRIAGLFGDKKPNALLPKYCVMLSYLNPARKNDKAINDFLAKEKLQNNINTVLGFDINMFGGSKEAEDIRLQIKTTDSTLIAQLLSKAKLLQNQYPKNKDVSKLVADLSQVKITEPEKKPDAVITASEQPPPESAAPTQDKKETIDCDACKGTGAIQKECPDCKDKKEKLCPHCIGSGVLISFVECPDCKGKGKTWLGMQCKTCEGKGKIRKKEDCPDCNEAGKAVCQKCQGKKTISQPCTKCNGTGKIEK